MPQIESTFYNKTTSMRKLGPFADLEKEASTLSTKGEVLIMGDYNARTK